MMIRSKLVPVARPAAAAWIQRTWSPPGRPRAMASMAAAGSAPVTSYPRVANSQASSPVPQPMSRIRAGGAPGRLR